MISVTQALSIVNEHVFNAEPIEITIQESLNYVLAENVFAKISMPPFRQSAMDGYAVCLHATKDYTVIGEVKAGDSEEFTLKPGEAVRIFTGAPVPHTANAVVMQEKVERNNIQIQLTELPIENQNIRPKGEQINENELAIKSNTLLTPSIISFLASLGIYTIKVYPKPKVGIVVTGNELIAPGTTYKKGKIYESNSILLATTLQNEGIKDYTIYKVEDDYEKTENTLQKAINENNFVLVSGGISVGDYDFVGKALENLETKKLFYKIKQKPGKPLFFGKNNKTYIFALPGNPASALTCFYIYALPMLRNFYKHQNPHLIRTKKQLSHNYKVKGIRAQFLKAKYQNNTVKVLEAQSSAMIHSFNIANCLIFIPENTTELKSNTEVAIILLPQ